MTAPHGGRTTEGLQCSPLSCRRKREGADLEGNTGAASEEMSGSASGAWQGEAGWMEFGAIGPGALPRWCVFHPAGHVWMPSGWSWVTVIQAASSHAGIE